MTHRELVIRGVKWLKNTSHYKYRSPIILPEYSCSAHSIPDVIGMSSDRTTVLECKVSRSDFMADFKKSHRSFIDQLGNSRFYLVTANLIRPEEINNGWGLLYCYDNKITVQKESEWFTNTRAQEYRILYSLIRRISYNDARAKTIDLITNPLRTLEDRNYHQQQVVK